MTDFPYFVFFIEKKLSFFEKPSHPLSSNLEGRILINKKLKENVFKIKTWKKKIEMFLELQIHLPFLLFI
jgi:hypothetical protein